MSDKKITKSEFANGINRHLKLDLIERHLENWNGLKKASIEYFLQSGKVSGSFLTALEEMMDEYAEKVTR